MNNRNLDSLLLPPHSNSSSTTRCDADASPADELRPLPYNVSSVESEVIHFFVYLAATLSLPKSIGELFGLLYCADNPLPFEEVVSRLGISKGSVSQGLRFLQSLNAVESVHQARDRRTFYRAEASLRRLLGGLLEHKVGPQLQTAEQRLENLADQLAGQTDEPVLASSKRVLRQRIDALRHWHRTAQRFLPLLARMASPGTVGNDPMAEPLPAFNWNDEDSLAPEQPSST